MLLDGGDHLVDLFWQLGAELNAARVALTIRAPVPAVVTGCAGATSMMTHGSSPTTHAS